MKPTKRVIDAEGRLAGRLKKVGKTSGCCCCVRANGPEAGRERADLKGERILVYARPRLIATGPRRRAPSGRNPERIGPGGCRRAWRGLRVDGESSSSGKKADAPLVAATEAAARAGIKLSDDYG